MVIPVRKGVIPIFLMIVAAVLVSGCIFGSGQLNQVPPHIIAATEALSDLDLIEGRVNTFVLDDEIWMINQILSEIEEIPEDEPDLAAQYQAYRTWNDAFGLMSQVFKEDYMIYQSHLRQADRLYEDFNYIGWRDEIMKAKNQVSRMIEKSIEAAYMMDTIQRDALPKQLHPALEQSQREMMEIAHQGTVLESRLHQKL
ncbi:hypothetical protein J2T58_000426 [Methanocalculus alkaliphilus]|nr:hypothetical protein [Methanocalculus alkaliphilus]